MTSTVSVPRELLDRCCKRMYDTMQGDLHEELRALLSAPSPAGVDGLEVVGYLLTKGNQLSRMPASAADEPLCRLSDAQAIIDGLRGEVERKTRSLDSYGEELDKMQESIDSGYRAKMKYKRERNQLAKCLKFARTTMSVVADNANLRGVEHRSLISEVKRIDAALSAVCAAAPNIAPTSEHKVPEGIVSITRSLGRAIVRFNTSEQLNEFYRAAKSALPTERSGQIRSTPR